MIYDYSEKEGYVSLWIGTCGDYSTLDKYLTTEYIDEKADPSKIFSDMFLPSNRERACERELMLAFNEEFYNQFEYDFGLSFDEDFREANVLKTSTGNLEKLFEGFSYCDTFIDELKTLTKLPLTEYNAAVALYDFKYCGGIPEAAHENIHLHFLGYCRYRK